MFGGCSYECNTLQSSIWVLRQTEPEVEGEMGAVLWVVGGVVTERRDCDKSRVFECGRVPRAAGLIGVALITLVCQWYDVMRADIRTCYSFRFLYTLSFVACIYLFSRFALAV